MKEQTPVLSIGIIFKNEIRCLERCLKSLQPLQKAVSCELVMADTGSTDGSREIAERYADILFDFPWINDFSAARNAVMDRCSGKWYFSIDADEWLDEDVSALANFFTDGTEKHYDMCGLTERNYDTYDVNGDYGVFMPWRLIRLSTGARYSGAIHESWKNRTGLRQVVLANALLHHDGYVEINTKSAAGKEKRARNMVLLRKKLEDNPEDLLTFQQFIESGRLESDFDEKLREAVSLVERRVKFWDVLGGSIFRHAIIFGITRDLPEKEEWIQKAEELFSNSYFIRLDGAFMAAMYYMDQEDFVKCAHWCEIGVRAHKDFRAGRGDIRCQAVGVLLKSTPLYEACFQIMLARSYVEIGRPSKALPLLSGINFTLLDAQWTGNLLESMQQLHFKGKEGASALIGKVWEEIQAPVPSEEQAKQRREKFLRTASRRFKPDYLKLELEDPDCRRPVYTLYTPLRGKCVPGDAAAILESEDPDEIAAVLSGVEDWNDLPSSALVHAFQAGICFPLPDRTMNIEEMDVLAAQLAESYDTLHRILAQAAEKDFSGNWQTLAWARGLALSAVQTYSWEDESAGLQLAQTFAKVEQRFLTSCYTPETLQKENLFMLPPMHRFGWYCVQAFNALEAGDSAGYARLLREGLAAHKGMKKMVEFLVEHTPQLQNPPQELRELADKVRGMLAAFDPGDPAVAVIKQSPVYQKVAYLIEGIEAPVMGGLTQ